MKKIIICVLIVVLMAAIFGGCGNSSVGMGNFTYNLVHIADGSGNYGDYPIQKWYYSSEGEPGVEVVFNDGNALWLSEGTYILIKDYCPLCDKNH